MPILSPKINEGEEGDVNDEQKPPGEGKPSFAERMIAAGESMEKAGDATAKAGCSVMTFMIALFVLAVIVFLLWAVAC